MNLKIKRKQMSGSVFECKDVKNHGLAWSLETLLLSLMHCLKIPAITFACIRNCDMYIYIYIHIYMIYECIYVYTHLPTHSYTLTYTCKAEPKWIMLHCMCITFLLKLTIFLIMYTFSRYICRGFQHSKFGKTFKEIKLV